MALEEQSFGRQSILAAEHVKRNVSNALRDKLDKEEERWTKHVRLLNKSCWWKQSWLRNHKANISLILLKQNISSSTLKPFLNRIRTNETISLKSTRRFFTMAIKSLTCMKTPLTISMSDSLLEVPIGDLGNKKGNE